ncbi:hypothetical protein HK102_013426 [Quaeritorhiza haematococci]|nr:hypothetical protein HK102_013426 [Quaeritorhiza haematococci]
MPPIIRTIKDATSRNYGEFISNLFINGLVVPPGSQSGSASYDIVISKCPNLVSLNCNDINCNTILPRISLHTHKKLSKLMLIRCAFEPAHLIEIARNRPLSHVIVRDCNQLSTTDYQQFTAHLSNKLEVFRVGPMNDHGFFVLGDTLNILIEEPPCEFNSCALEIVLEKRPPLQVLGLAGCLLIADYAVSMIAKSSKLRDTLTDLNLGRCHLVGDTSVVELANLKNLRRLNVTMTDVTDKSMVDVVKKLKKLEAINLSFTKITDLTVFTIAANCPKLTSADFDVIPGITDESIRYLAVCCPSLSRLSLNWVTGLSGETLYNLAHFCSNLSSLFLIGNRAPHFAWEYLIERCRTLRHVVAYGCRGMSEKVAEESIKGHPDLEIDFRRPQLEQEGEDGELRCVCGRYHDDEDEGADDLGEDESDQYSEDNEEVEEVGMEHANLFDGFAEKIGVGTYAQL